MTDGHVWCYQRNTRYAKRKTYKLPDVYAKKSKIHLPGFAVAVGPCLKSNGVVCLCQRAPVPTSCHPHLEKSAEKGKKIQVECSGILAH
jgi:hypothetical protein